MKNTKGMTPKQKRTRMAEDGEDWNGLEMTILKSLLANFWEYTNDDVAPFKCETVNAMKITRIISGTLLINSLDLIVLSVTEN